MRNVLLLLKLQLDNQSDLLKTLNPKKMIPAILKTVALLVLGIIALSFAISQVTGMRVLVTQELLAIVLLATQIVSLVFATGNIINTLYMSNDNEMLFCLPVTPNQLFISKILKIYINEVKVNAMISIPLFYVLGSYAKPTFAFGYYLSIIPLLIIMPITPIVLGAVISIPAMIIIKFLKKHAVLSVVVVFSLIASLLTAYMYVLGKLAPIFTNIDLMGAQQYDSLRTINNFINSFGPKIGFYYQLSGAMLDLRTYGYVYPIFIAACIVVAAATIFFTRYFFFKAAMSNLEKTVKKKRERKYDTFKKRGVVASLFLKEFYCVFRSPSDIFEYFLFTILMPFIVFSCDKLLVGVAIDMGGTNMKPGAHLMVLAILAMLSNVSSASAISRDGGNFYSSKIIPVSFYSQMFVKFLFNATFTSIALIITAITSFFLFPAWEVILGTIAVMLAAAGHIAYCIDSDIKNPTVATEGNDQASIVSKTTPKSLVYGFAVGFIMGFFLMLTASLELSVLPYIILIVAALVFLIYRLNNLILRINLKYDKIEM